MQAPKCQWQPSKHGDMELLRESDTFWFFGCGCGCCRAISKPSVQAASAYRKHQEDIETLKRVQHYNSSRPAYSYGNS